MLEEGSDGATHGNTKENEALAAQPHNKGLSRNSSRWTMLEEQVEHHGKTYRQLQMEAVEDHGVPEHKVNGTDNKSEM